MSSKIKLMLADDSSVVRRILTQIVTKNNTCEVAFAAKNGKEAVDNFDAVKPDIVVLDVEMPVMDGIEAVAGIRKKNADVPIVMCSSLTSRGAEATLDALAHGANDYVAKPSGTGHMTAALAKLEAELLPKLVSLGSQYQKRRSPQPALISRKPLFSAKPTTSSSSGPVEVVVIGVSTGGPNALAEVLPNLPVNLGVPVLIVQHMPPVFTGLLAERLDKDCSLPVREATDKTDLNPGTIWIAPGDYHMEVIRQGTKTILRTHQAPPENSCRPAVDVLFRSAAQIYGKNTLAVMLTGMGKDGLAGSQKIHQLGGQVIAQDEATSTVWGMPKAVVDAGIARSVLPLDKIANEIGLLAASKPKLAATTG